jgi:hypothetical protein
LAAGVAQVPRPPPVEIRTKLRGEEMPRPSAGGVGRLKRAGMVLAGPLLTSTPPHRLPLVDPAVVAQMAVRHS